VSEKENMDKEEAIRKGPLMQLEAADQDIEIEFEKLMKSKISRRKYVIAHCLKRLYKSFRSDPEKFLGVDGFLGEKRLPLDYERYSELKNRADTYRFRINEEYLTDYYGFETSSVEFGVERATEYIPKYEREGPVYRLKVLYEKIEYLDIFSKVDSVAAKNKDALDSVALRSPSASEKTFFDDYLEQVEQRNRHLDVRYFDILLPLIDNALELKDTYIRLRATKDDSMTPATPLTEGLERSSGIPEQIVKEKGIVKKPGVEIHQHLFVDQILQSAFDHKDKAERHMVFIGSPGSGKTTLLRHLALSTAMNYFNKWGMEDFVPILIDLSEYARNKGGDLLKFALKKAVENIVDRSTEKGIKKALRNCINQCETNGRASGKVLFLMDALDETGTEKRRIVRQIEDIRNRYGKAFIIVTSRTIDYYESPLIGFRRYLVDKLHDQEPLDFVRKWFELLGEKKTIEQPEMDWKIWANERADTLIQKMDNVPPLRLIITNPLCLTFLVLLASDPTADIPQTRADLYQQYIEKLILTWETKRDSGISDLSEDLRGGFTEICWIVHRALYGDIQAEPTRDFVRKNIVGSYSLNPNQILEFWIKAGVFHIVKTEHQNELILPTHSTFLNYGFARKLADLWDDPKEREELWNNIEINLRNPLLYEPLLLLTDMIQFPEDFLARICRCKDDLLHKNLAFVIRALFEIHRNKLTSAFVSTLLSHVSKLWSDENDLLELFKIGIIDQVGFVGGVDYLGKLYRSEQNRSVKGIIAKAIRHHSSDSGFKILARLYHDEKGLHEKMEIMENIGRCNDSKRALSFLLSLYKNEIEPDIREKIIWTIFALNKPAIIPKLEVLYHEERISTIRHSIILAISLIGDEKAVPILERFYHTGCHDERLQIMENIWKVGNKSTIPLLVRLHEREEKQNVRWAIAHAISHLGDKTTISVLKRMYRQESDTRYRFSILRMMGKMGGRDAIPFLEEIYRQDLERNGRWEIIAAFRDIAKFEFIKAFGNIYENMGDNSHKRQIESFWETWENGGLAVLSQFYENEEDLSLRKDIVKTICSIGNSKALDSLKGFYNNDAEEPIRKAMATSISSFCDDKIIPLLENNNNEEVEAWVRRQFTSSISSLVSDKILPLLDRLYYKEVEGSVKKEIVRYICDLEFDRTISLLENLYNNESDLSVKEYIVRWICRLADGDTMPLLEKLYGMRFKRSLREEIVRSICNVARIENIAILKRLLKQEDKSNLKCTISKAIGDLGYQEFSLSKLKILLTIETDPEIRYHIARAIGEVGNTELATYHLKLLFSKQSRSNIRLEIGRAIDNFGKKKLANFCFYIVYCNNRLSFQPYDILDILKSIRKTNDKTGIWVLTRLFKSETDAGKKFMISKVLNEMTQALRLSIFESEPGKWIIAEHQELYNFCNV
jgi:HEAT repeat protein